MRVCGAADAEPSGQIDLERIETLFRRSLDLDPDDASNHERAGNFYFEQGKLGEAERCLARGSRLQRDDGDIALRLAEIYRRTDRPRDALGVLDLCLREGCTDARVAWEAAMVAVGIEQFESMLTYLDRMESLDPGRPWVCYYRAFGLLDQGQPEAANEALAQEEAQPGLPIRHHRAAGLRRECSGAARTLSRIPRARTELSLVHDRLLLDDGLVAAL